MHMTLDAVREAILKQEITAISLDTSAFDGKGRHLESGLLKRVQQFKDSAIVFVLSEVVQRELNSHLVKDASEAEAGLKKALKNMSTSWRLSKQKVDEIWPLAVSTDSATTMANSRLSAYMDATGAIVLKAEEYISVSELVGRYFDHRPPFADKEKKKNEFPDALAVLSLETWAAQHGTMMVVVTNDGDWKSYCAESERLVAVDNLADALSCFQEQEASYHCREIAESICHGDPLGLLEKVTTATREREDSIDFSVEADSQFRCEEDMVEATFSAVNIQEFAGIPVLEPVEYDGATLVARLTVDVSADITAHFSFEKWDGIDREYMSMGSGSATTTEDLTTEVLITFGGKLPDEPTIEDIEVGPIKAFVSFTDLEPDWMSNPDNFD